MEQPILLGAVAYDPKVVTIWEGIRDYFQDEGVPLDFALFSNYERQVEELLAGHIDIAWNTPLAHVRVRQRTGGQSLSLGMRDSDRDFHAKIVVRRASCVAAGKARQIPARSLRDELGKPAPPPAAGAGRAAGMDAAARRWLPQPGEGPGQRGCFNRLMSPTLGVIAIDGGDLSLGG